MVQHLLSHPSVHPLEEDLGLTSSEVDAASVPIDDDGFDAQFPVEGLAEVRVDGRPALDVRSAEQKPEVRRSPRQFEHLTMEEVLRGYREANGAPVKDTKARLVQLDLEIVARYAGMDYVVVRAVRLAADHAWAQYRRREGHDRRMQEERDRLALERVARARR